jgi:hypothetical protein
LLGVDATFESERPVVYSLKEIEEATSHFDGSRKIRQGGYGSVYWYIERSMISFPLGVCS